MKLKLIAAAALFVTLVSGCASVRKDTPPGSKTCAGTVHEYEQWGGKYYTSTWWCTGSDGRVTGIWFEK